MFLDPLVVTPLFYRFTPLADTRPDLVSEITKVTAFVAALDQAVDRRGTVDKRRDRQ